MPPPLSCARKNSQSEFSESLIYADFHLLIHSCFMGCLLWRDSASFPLNISTNLMWGPPSWPPSGTSLPVLPTAQLRCTHTLKWQVALPPSPLLPSLLSCLLRDRKLTISHYSFLYHAVCPDRKILQGSLWCVVWTGFFLNGSLWRVTSTYLSVPAWHWKRILVCCPVH